MTPRNKAINEQVRSESKEKILMAALKLFGRNGFHTTSVSSIAKEAGVSKGLIYNYYESKEELLKGLVERLMNEGDAFMEVMNHDDPNEVLRNMFLLLKDYLVQKKEFWRLAVSLSVQHDVGKLEFLRDMIKEKADGFFETFKNLLSQKGYDNPRAEALYLGALFDGISLQYIVTGEEYPLDEIINTLIKKYCE